MKKRAVFSGVMALLVGSSAAWADDNTTLTTKNYVDSGLRAVYDVAKDASDAIGDANSGLIKDVNDLKDTVGDSTDGLVKAVDDLETTVGDANSGLVKDVDDLQTTVGDANSGLVKKVNDLENTVGATYTGGVGISVDSNNQIGLEGLTGATDNKTYVFKNGQWVELETVNNWNPSVLTATPQQQEP